MAKVGKKPWVPTKEIIKKVEELASRGMEQQDIALCIGIGISTFHNKKNEFQELEDAVKRGRAKGVSHVTNALLKNIDLGNVTAQIFYLKTQAKWRDNFDASINLKVDDETVRRIRNAEEKYK
jgi:hypothetical protein